MAISKELKERWIARLESPDAKWAGQTLLDKGTGGMCCLGHLADMQGHLTPDGELIDPFEEGWEYSGDEVCILVKRYWSDELDDEENRIDV